MFQNVKIKYKWIWVKGKNETKHNLQVESLWGPVLQKGMVLDVICLLTIRQWCSEPANITKVMNPFLFKSNYIWTVQINLWFEATAWVN